METKISEVARLEIENAQLRLALMQAQAQEIQRNQKEVAAREQQRLGLGPEYQLNLKTWRFENVSAPAKGAN